MFRRRGGDGETRAPEARGLDLRPRDSQAAGGFAGCEALDADRLGEPVPIATLIARAFGVDGRARPGSSRGPDGTLPVEVGPAGRRRHLHVVPEV